MKPYFGWFLLQVAILNERGRLGLFPLFLASRGLGVGTVKLLLDAGADVKANTVTAPPSVRGQVELGNQTPLHMAAASGNAQLVKLLLDHGADVQARDMRGMTPLMMAAASEAQDEETIRVLLAAGSDLNAKAEDGQTAMAWARKWGPAGVSKIISGSMPAEVDAVKLPAAAWQQPELRDAVEKTIALLQSSSAEYFKQSGCSGCHHQMLTGIAVGLARERGWKVDEPAAIEQLRAQVAVRKPELEALLQGVNIGGAPMAEALLLTSFAAQDYPVDSFTVPLAHFVAESQGMDGSWHSPAVRPPIQYSDFTNTAFAIRALKAYAPAAAELNSNAALCALEIGFVRTTRR